MKLSLVGVGAGWPSCFSISFYATSRSKEFATWLAARGTHDPHRWSFASTSLLSSPRHFGGN
eukprot:1009219-Prorocentrum_lima.AAC.1